MSAFQPPQAVRLAIIRRLKEADAGPDARALEARRSALESQLERLKDLYLFGDVTKDEYSFKKQLLQHELAALEPAPVADVSAAAA